MYRYASPSWRLPPAQATSKPPSPLALTPFHSRARFIRRFKDGVSKRSDWRCRRFKVEFRAGARLSRPTPVDLRVDFKSVCVRQAGESAAARGVRTNGAKSSAGPRSMSPRTLTPTLPSCPMTSGARRCARVSERLACREFTVRVLHSVTRSRDAAV